MGKLMKEFKEFAIQGNMVDMAVGIIIGAAFKDLVNSLVNNLMMPVVSLFTGRIDFSNLFLSLNGEHYETLAAAKEVDAATLNYGQFITDVINFLIMAFVIFMIVRQINRLNNKAKKQEEGVPAGPTEKECPYCKTKISIHAVRCPHCTSMLEE